MKKEILKLMQSNEGTFKINNICYLRRWTKDGLGNDVDKLKLEFNTINDVRFSIYPTDIKSRNYEDIIQEVDILIKQFTKELQEELCKNLKAGYRNVD